MKQKQINEVLMQLNECFYWIDEMTNSEEKEWPHIKEMLQGLEDAMQLIRTHCINE